MLVTVERAGVEAVTEPVGVALVQLGARPLQQAPVGGVADQDVVEAEDRLAQYQRVVGLDELPAPQRSRCVVELARRAPARGGRSTAPRVNWRPMTEARSRTARSLRAEPLDARREQRLDRRRHLHRGELERRPPTARRRGAARRRRRACAPARARTAGCPRSPPAPARDRGRAARRRRAVGRQLRWRRPRRARRARRRRRRRPGDAATAAARAAPVGPRRRRAAARRRPTRTRCSTRSRSSGSAQWRSSSTSTTGRARASPSSRRRTAQNVSSGDAGAPAPSRPASAVDDPVALGLVVGDERRDRRCRTTSGGTASPMPAAARNASAIGANVASPPASQRPVDDRGAVARTRRSSSSSKRVFPRPGEPSTIVRPAPPVATRVERSLELLELRCPPDQRRGRARDRRVERHQPVRRDQLGAALELQRRRRPRASRGRRPAAASAPRG